VPTEPKEQKKTRIIVLGGGFAGIYTARHLLQAVGRREDVEVELLSDENYFVFQPLLPEVAAGGIAATHVVNPIRELLPGVRFRCCKIHHIDFVKREVMVVQGQGLRLVAVPYDHLVFCLGKVSNFSSMPGVAEHAFAMKDLADAFKLRNHVIRCLELADIEADPKHKQALLTFLVAGGGFSGVETIGELRELVTRSLKHFTHIKASEIKFALVHAQDTILPEMPMPLRVSAKRILEERNIEMILETRVRAASPDRVYLSGDRVIDTRTFVCTVGNAPNPIAKAAMASGGFEEAKIDGRGLGIFATERTLECVGKPGYWAVGDCAGVPSPTGKGFSPPTAQFAIREAKYCAENIRATLDGTPRKDFQFKALGMLASLGQRSAVADMMGIRLSGFIAWVAWRFIYLMKLPGFGRRLRVALDWWLDLFFERDITELKLISNARFRVNHYEAGEQIIAEGEIGREMYMIRAGTVEAYWDKKEGRDAKVLRTLGPGDVFGEVALLGDSPRTASVRSSGPVDLLVMSREDFLSINGTFPVLSDHFGKLFQERYPKEMASASLLDVVRRSDGMDSPAVDAPASESRHLEAPVVEVAKAVAVS